MMTEACLEVQPLEYTTSPRYPIQNTDPLNTGKVTKLCHTINTNKPYKGLKVGRVVSDLK